MAMIRSPTPSGHRGASPASMYLRRDASYRPTSGAAVLWQELRTHTTRRVCRGISSYRWNPSHALTWCVTVVTFSLDITGRVLATALKQPRFPVLEFDELRFRLAAGIVLERKWLVPGESLVSMLWKFCSANVLAPDWLVQQMSPAVDPSVRVVPAREVVGITCMRRMLRLPENVLHASLLDPSLPASLPRYAPILRSVCCARLSVPAVSIQRRRPLSCPSAAARNAIPYVINTETAGAPFRSVSCHSHFSYGRL